MMRRREILVLDYSATGPKGPHALSMYDCLAMKYNLAFVSTPVPGLVRLLNRIRTMHPRRGEWSRRYWRAIEAYQHSPAGFRAATRAYSRAARRMMKTRRFDAILQYGALFGPVELPEKIPCLTYHDGNMAITCSGSSHQAAFLTGSQYDEWMRLEQNLVLKAARVLTYSRRTRNSYINDYGCSEDRVIAVGSSDWVRRRDTEWLQGRLSAGLDGEEPARDPKTILFVHTDFARKGGEVLLHAFAELLHDIPDAKLLIAGPNPELAQGRNVHAIGVVHDRQQLLSLYDKAAVFVLPSLNDPFPRVIFEAMAHGLPCIGSRVGGIPEQIVDGKTGLLVDVNDVQGLARAMRRLLSNPDERRSFGVAGIHHLIDSFLPESVASRVARQIEAVCGEEPVGPMLRLPPLAASEIQKNPVGEY